MLWTQALSLTGRQSRFGEIPFENGCEREAEDTTEGLATKNDRPEPHHRLADEKKVEQHGQHRLPLRRTQVAEPPDEFG